MASHWQRARKQFLQLSLHAWLLTGQVFCSLELKTYINYFDIGHQSCFFAIIKWHVNLTLHALLKGFITHASLLISSSWIIKFVCVIKIAHEYIYEAQLIFSFADNSLIVFYTLEIIYNGAFGKRKKKCYCAIYVLTWSSAKPRKGFFCCSLRVDVLQVSSECPSARNLQSSSKLNVSSCGKYIWGRRNICSEMRGHICTQLFCFLPLGNNRTVNEAFFLMGISVLRMSSHVDKIFQFFEYASFGEKANRSPLFGCCPFPFPVLKLMSDVNFHYVSRVSVTKGIKRSRDESWKLIHYIANRPKAHKYLSWHYFTRTQRQKWKEKRREAMKIRLVCW